MKSGYLVNEYDEDQAIFILIQKLYHISSKKKRLSRRLKKFFTQVFYTEKI